MTVDRFLKPGEGEMLKGAVHAAVCGLALVCGVYNAAAWITRRERHLGVNAVMYSALAIWEAAHVPAKGLPRVLRRIHQWLRQTHLQTAQDYWSQTGGGSHLP